MSTRLHALTGVPPRGSTPTQLEPLSQLRSVLSDLEQLGGDGDGDARAEAGEAEAAVEAASALAKLEDTAKAIDEVAANHEAVVTFARAEKALDRGELKTALDGFRKARTLGHPEPAECHSECGGILEELGKWSEAAAEYGAAVALRPSHALYHASRGYALMELEQLPAAAADFAAALALDPDDADVAEQLAGVQAKVGEQRLAKLLEGVEKEKDRRPGRRRPCTEELAGLEAALPGAAASVVREVGGLALVAALVEDGGPMLGVEVEATVSVIYQAIGAATLSASAASAAYASRSRKSGTEPEPEPGAHGMEDPLLQEALEKARVVEQKMERNRFKRKNAEMAMYKQAAIERERLRNEGECGLQIHRPTFQLVLLSLLAANYCSVGWSERGGKVFRPGVNEDMEELARLQRRAAEAMAGTAVGALTISAKPALPHAAEVAEAEVAEAEVSVVLAELPNGPLARARALMVSGPPIEAAAGAVVREHDADEDDWRSQLSEIGRSLVDQHSTATADGVAAPVTPSPGSSGAIVLDGSSSEDDELQVRGVAHFLLGIPSCAEPDVVAFRCHTVPAGDTSGSGAERVGDGGCRAGRVCGDVDTRAAEHD